jgi:hypothetical protein
VYGVAQLLLSVLCGVIPDRKLCRGLATEQGISWVAGLALALDGSLERRRMIAYRVGTADGQAGAN